MKNILISEYQAYHADDILPLYQSVGWTNYTNNPSMLENAFRNSLKILAARDGDRVIGIIRAVGDGHSIVYIQDILIDPEYQHKGIGKALIGSILELYGNVYQKALMTDNISKTVSFYQSMVFHQASEFECTSFFKNY